MALVSALHEHSVSPNGEIEPGLTSTSWYRATQFSPPVHDWVKEHVIPILGVQHLTRGQFRQEFHTFIKKYESPDIICDWHADAEHFCKMLAGVDYGSSLDFDCRITIIKTPFGQPVSKQPHNALADATALMEWYEFGRFGVNVPPYRA